MFFFLLWGKKETRKQLGYVADFCPICRKVSAFVARELGVASHVYFVSVEKSDVHGEIRECLTCEASFDFDYSRYVELADRPGRTVEHLVEETFPDIGEVFARRLALERQIAANPHSLEPGLRGEFLMEPFHIAAPYFANRHVNSGIRLLTTALRPLAPAEDEIRACLTHFRKARAPIGGMLSTGAVMKKLSRPAVADYDY